MKILTPIIFLLFTCSLTSQSQEERTIASIDSLFSLEKMDTENLMMVWDIMGELDYYTSEKPFEYSMRAIQESKTIGSNIALAEFYDELGLMYCNVGKYDSSIHYFNLAIPVYQLNEDYTGETHALGVLRYVYAMLEEYDTSLEHCYRALAIFQKNEDEEGIGATYNDIAGTLLRTKRYGEAMKNAQKGLDILERFDNHFETAMTMDKLVECKLHFEEYEEALQLADRMINLAATNAKNLGSDVGAGFLMRRAEVYQSLGNLDKAITNLDSASSLVPDNLLYLNDIIFSKVQLFNDQKRYKESISELTTFFKTDTLNYLYDHSYESLLTVAETYAGIGEYDTAYLFQLEYDSIRTTKNAHETSLKMESLKTEFETEEKEQLIVLQENQLSQQKTIKWLAFAVAIIFGVSLFQAIRNARKRKKASIDLENINTQLQSKNKENELLLKEIHHRVKNNLQTISSLLSLQSESIQDEAAWDAVQESKNRVASMAMIHQKLYQGENLAAIEMKDYFRTIGDAIKESFGGKASHVALKVDMDEMDLDVDTAIPIGLITNELITNSIKHAFPNGEDGAIEIRMRPSGDGFFSLEINDNGTPSSKASGTPGFGSTLVQLLTMQLQGKLEKSEEDGTSTIISFKVPETSAA